MCGVMVTGGDCVVHGVVVLRGDDIVHGVMVMHERVCYERLMYNRVRPMREQVCYECKRVRSITKRVSYECKRLRLMHKQLYYEHGMRAMSEWGVVDDLSSPHTHGRSLGNHTCISRAMAEVIRYYQWHYHLLHHLKLFIIIAIMH